MLVLEDLFLLLFFASAASAFHEGFAIFARQNTNTETAFTPQFTTTCRRTSLKCGGVCYDPKGGSCCDESRNYRCIPGTYCLFIDELCCPDSVDPETCVKNSNLELPENFPRPSRYPTPVKSSSSSGPKSSSDKAAFPTVDENSGVPKAAAPTSTTYGPITASVSGKPVTAAYSGEIIPLQTPTDHKPAPKSLKDALLGALAKDPETKAFGELLKQEPSFFEALDANKEYYIFAPTTKHVVEYLKRLHGGSQRREVQVRPNEVMQAAEKPQGGPDIKRVASTLITALIGQTKYVNLGVGEGARVVSQPADSQKGEVRITSGFGKSTLVYADDIPFEKGIIKKCDGFFTEPNALETVFGSTDGRLWSTALQKANMLTELSQKQMVTIFAIQDSGLDGSKPPGSADFERLIHDSLSYTPDMSDGLCLGTRGGGTVRITRKENDILVNGVEIKKPDVIARNGVIHYLEKIPPVEKCTVTSMDKGEEKKNSGTTAVISLMTGFGGAFIGLILYL